jgi:hypothetical protein
MRDSVLTVGRELLVIKAQIEHGPFQAWVRQECGLNVRTAERAIQAAELVGKNDKLSYLPADGLLALSSGAAKPVAEEIIDRIEAGERPTAAEIKRKIRAAVKGENTTSRSKGPLDKIQDAITKLNKEQLHRFSEWFDQFRERGRAGANSEPESAFTHRPMLALPAPPRSPVPERADVLLLEQAEPPVPAEAQAQLSAEADEREELICSLPRRRCHYPNTCRRNGCCLGALAKKAQSGGAAAAESVRVAQ